MSRPARRIRVRDLSIEEIEQIAEQFKADLVLEMKRAGRKRDPDGVYAATIAEEYIDRFLYSLKMEAASGLREYLSRPPRARRIHLSPRIIHK